VDWRQCAVIILLCLLLYNSGSLPPVHELFKRPSYFTKVTAGNLVRKEWCILRLLIEETAADLKGNYKCVEKAVADRQGNGCRFYNSVFKIFCITTLLQKL